MTFAAATVEDLLDFEAKPFRTAGLKEAAMRERFGFSPARYHQLLGRIVTDPGRLAVATQHNPKLTARLVAERTARTNP